MNDTPAPNVKRDLRRCIHDQRNTAQTQHVREWMVTYLFNSQFILETLQFVDFSFQLCLVSFRFL